MTMLRAIKIKEIAKKIAERDASKHNTLLQSYKAELRRVSHGNTYKNKMDKPDQPYYQDLVAIICAFEVYKRGCVVACRSFMEVDKCHLKTKYGGQLLIAVGRDPND